MYTGKECFPSVAYEVICTARKFIQSVSVGHPGSRNNKHIVKTDKTVLDLLEGNGWLNSRAWRCVGANNTTMTFVGVYLICDGGYHKWPCLVSPVKHGAPGSPTMKWRCKIESVRKYIEGVFGILKRRFKFLKNFNNLHNQGAIDNAFVCCAMLHNMMLKADGYLDENLPPFSGGVEERLPKSLETLLGTVWKVCGFVTMMIRLCKKDLQVFLFLLLLLQCIADILSLRRKCLRLHWQPESMHLLTIISSVVVLLHSTTKNSERSCLLPPPPQSCSRTTSIRTSIKASNRIGR